MRQRLFLMAGGGTGGHVIPAIAVARELQAKGHEILFIGTQAGMEAKLVPAAGFPIEWIEIGGLKNVGIRRTLRSLAQLPIGVGRVLGLIGKRKPAAVFSMGGYAAGPVVLAAWIKRLPIVVMEPNAMPGLTNRRMGRLVARALLSFPEAARFFPAGRSEVTGLPVRSEFFAIKPRRPATPLSLLITGGSQGSHTLNRAARESWPLFREAGCAVRFLHQTGAKMWEAIDAAFCESGMEGEVVPFIKEMPAAFSEADVIVCRSGAGAVAELAAAGKPSILVPFPYAADDHQLRNAEAFQREGAALLVPDREFTGQRLFDEVRSLCAAPETLERMGNAARRLARPGAAERAARILEEISRTSGATAIDSEDGSRNNTL